MDYTLDQINTLFENEAIKNVEDALEKLEKKTLGFEHTFTVVGRVSLRCLICNHRRDAHLEHSLENLQNGMPFERVTYIV